MAGFENKLSIWGIIAYGAKIIPESFKVKEQFQCTQMCNW